MTLKLSGDEDAQVEGFERWAAGRGLTLYPHQEEALLELATGAHVICSTPTGSGKSMIAVAAHALAMAQGKRSYYTAPLKALVSEKFFDLVEIFGPQNVGMLTGDTQINAQAPIICCTAEILANQALREGVDLAVDQVVMDEFHFYADPQRGWAWQVPLLELRNAQFVLLSATLGDVQFFVEDLTKRTGRPVAVITHTERPVPLDFTYSMQPLADLLQELVSTHRAPVYVVNFTQAAAIEQASALLSIQVASKDVKAQIASELKGFTFSRGFGATLSRLLRNGIGVHHAGMLPRYRRLVERLAQQGLLQIICGTDTLGVGINVPIRTVVFTGLTKYDGDKTRHLSAREFHQIAGRAGRAGYDDRGYVIVQAPEHVIENAKALEKAGDDERKRRKIVRKKAPTGVVNWTDKTFERLRDSEPEPLTSQFRVTHALVLNVLSRWGDPVPGLIRLLTDNHEPITPRNPHLREAARIYRSLRIGGVIERLAHPDSQGRRVRLVQDVPDEFALNSPLSPFGLAALELLDPEDPGFAFDVVSVIEAITENPRPVLIAQEKSARTEAIAAMKADGVEYNERMEALEEVTYPQPLAELLGAAYTSYASSHPWVKDYELAPKSVVRQMAELGLTFTELISRYQLTRSEGVVLRYLSDVYQGIRQIVPPSLITGELADLHEWLGSIVRGVDSSLLAEWESLMAGEEPTFGQLAQDDGDNALFEPVSSVLDERAFTVLVRGAAFRLVELLDRDDLAGLSAFDPSWSPDDWADAFDPYWDDYDHLGTDTAARSHTFFHLTREASLTPPEQLLTGGTPPERVELPASMPAWWKVTQVLADPDGDHDWRIVFWVDIGASVAADRVVARIESVGPLAS